MSGSDDASRGDSGRTGAPDRTGASGRTVVVRIMGGLGNQLFQYACGRAMAESIGATLKLDLGGMVRGPSQLAAGAETPRGYDLPRLGIQPPVLSGAESDGPGMAERLFAARGLWRLLRATGRTRLRIGATLGCFDRMDGRPPGAVPQDVKRVVLRGYWQSQRCFAPIEDALRGELRAWRDSVASAAPPEDVVVIHVRRGDYRDPRIARMHPPLPRDYYLAALDAIAARRSIRAAMIVSDEPGRAIEELDLPLPVESAHSEANASLSVDADLRRMAQTRALVIANSSLSWWAAWLASACGGIVVAPDPWFGPAGRAFAHPAPSEWERIRWHHP